MAHQLVDITQDVKVDAGSIDGDYIPLESCKCGYEFSYWEFSVIRSDDPDDAKECPKCKRKLLASISVQVFEVIDAKNEETFSDPRPESSSK